MLETNNGTWCTCGDAPSGRVWGEGAGGWADSSLGLRVDGWSSWWVTCSPWQRGLRMALENIVKCPQIFQGDKVSRICRLDSAFTSPRTWRPWQHDHLSQWPRAEHREPGAPRRTRPHVEREPVHVCHPPHRPAFGLCSPHCQAPPTDCSGPMSPSTAPPATFCSRPPRTLATAPKTVSVRTCLWSFLPITESPPPPPQVEIMFRVRKGKTGSLKEVVVS